MRINTNYNIYPNFKGNNINLKTAPITAPLVADIFNADKGLKISKEIKTEIASLEAFVPILMNDNIDFLFDLRQEGINMKHRAEEKGEEALQLYLKKAKTTKDGRKVELIGNVLKEYTEDGKNVSRATEFKPNAKNPKEPVITRMIEKRQDGKYNLYLAGEYTEGYQLFSDDSESYDYQVVMCEPEVKQNGRFRFYSKGYKKDSTGNVFYDVSTFKKASKDNGGDFVSVDGFKAGERRFLDGTVMIDKEYSLGYEYKGSPAENYMEGYVKTPKGTLKIRKEIVSTIPMGLQSYRENYTKYQNSSPFWSKYYTRDGSNSPWQV